MMDTVYPSPMPSPSSAESNTPFLLAKASARPRIIQFTTISGMKTPSAESRLGAYALISIWMIFTSVAMITIYTGIRISDGVILRIREMITLDMINTTITATPIPMALFSVVVMARVEQSPRYRENTGFSRMNPAVKFSLRFILHPPPTSDSQPDIWLLHGFLQ